MEPGRTRMIDSMVVHCRNRRPIRCRYHSPTTTMVRCRIEPELGRQCSRSTIWAGMDSRPTGIPIDHRPSPHHHHHRRRHPNRSRAVRQTVDDNRLVLLVHHRCRRRIRGRNRMEMVATKRRTVQHWPTANRRRATGMDYRTRMDHCFRRRNCLTASRD